MDRFLLLLNTIIMATAQQHYLTIPTTSGAILRGDLRQEYGASYYAYLGIKYAEPPTDHLRFMPPVPKSPDTEVYNATAFGPVCPQPGTYSKKEMSEDCLNLNVYVPAGGSERCGGSRLPVVAVIHGGEMTSRSNRDDMYGPQLYIKHGVIIVTMNYRLGALGFLSAQTDDALGNAGLKDILLALRWIQDNIAQFGGDPDNVSVGGNSAGGVLAHYLVLSEQAKGLFKQAYSNSGSALGYRFFAKHPVDNAKALATKLGYQTEDTHEMIQKLKETDVFDIVAAQQDKNDTRNGFRPHSAFLPCAEPESDTAFITKEPIDIIRNGVPINVPFLAGFNKEEGIKMVPAIWKDPKLVDNLNNNFELCIPSNIEYPYGSQESKNLAASIKTHYFKDKDISNNTLSGFIDLITDTQFAYSIDSWIKIHKSNASSESLYYYVFDYDGELNWFKIANHIKVNGTAHVDDIGYKFVTDETKDLLATANGDSKRMSYIILKLWSNFQKYGNPTYDIEDITWRDCGEERDHLYLNMRPHMTSGSPLEERLSFWYNVYEQYDEYLKNGGEIEAKTVP